MDRNLAQYAAVCSAAIETFELLATKVAEAGDDHGRLRRAVADLVAFAGYHFRDEEAAMLDLGYDLEHPEDHALHVVEHQRLGQGLAGIQRALDGDIRQLTSAIRAFVANWVALHGLSCSRLRRYCGAAGPAPSFGARLQLAA